MNFDHTANADSLREAVKRGVQCSGSEFCEHKTLEACIIAAHFDLVMKQSQQAAFGEPTREALYGYVEGMAQGTGANKLASADTEAASLKALMERLRPLLADAMRQERKATWDLAHSPAVCGHARANYKDPTYGIPEYKGNEKCEACESVRRESVRQERRGFERGIGNVCTAASIPFPDSIPEGQQGQWVVDMIREAVPAASGAQPWDGPSCDRCQRQEVPTVRVETGFAGEVEYLCGDCVTKEREAAPATAQLSEEQVRNAIHQGPHICPVCDGRGNVPQGFYNPYPIQGYSTIAPQGETCRTCGGSGVLWMAAEAEKETKGEK